MPVQANTGHEIDLPAHSNTPFDADHRADVVGNRLTHAQGNGQNRRTNRHAADLDLGGGAAEGDTADVGERKASRDRLPTHSDVESVVRRCVAWKRNEYGGKAINSAAGLAGLEIGPPMASSEYTLEESATSHRS